MADEKKGILGMFGNKAKTTATTTAKTATATASTAAAKTTAAAGTAKAAAAKTAAAVKPAAASTVKPAAAAKSTFTDVPANAYYAEAVEWAVKKGITSGTTETTFTPDNPCTRGHAATFLWRAQGSPAPKTTKNPFTDVSEGAFYQAILWAAETGVIPGTTDSTFAPGEACTRGQVLTYILRTEGKPNATDADTTKWIAEKRLLAGLSGSATVPCTRADIVTFLYRVKAK